MNIYVPWLSEQSEQKLGSITSPQPGESNTYTVARLNQPGLAGGQSVCRCATGQGLQSVCIPIITTGLSRAYLFLSEIVW